MPDYDDDDLMAALSPLPEEGLDMSSVSANPWDLVGLTQNQLANQTPITAEVLRRVFEPNVLAQIRDAVLAIDQESTPYVNRWIAFDTTPPANAIELAAAVEELVLMGRSEIIQDRYQQLVRATWNRQIPNMEGGDRSREIRRERRRQQESLLELEAYLDEVIYEPENLNLTREANDLSSRLQSALGIDDNMLVRAQTLSTDIVYDNDGLYAPPVSAWQNVRHWFIPSAPLPQDEGQLQQAMLEFAWVRHTRRQADRYSLLARSIHRLGGGDRSLPSSLRGNFERLVDAIVRVNPPFESPEALVEVEGVSTGVVRGTALMISYDAQDWHSPLSMARVRRWLVPNRYLPADEVELVNARDELDHLNHRSDQGLRYTQLCRELWAAREADSGMLESVIIRRLLDVISSIEQLNPGVPAEDPYTRPEVEPIADVLLRRLRSGFQPLHAPPPSGTRPIEDTPKVEETEGTALDAILDWGDDS